MKKVFLMLSIAAMLFASCAKTEGIDTELLPQQVMGKWMLSQTNGVDAPTNAKVVYTFESETQGYVSASLVDFSEDNPKWTYNAPSNITIEGKTITLNGELNKTTSFVAVFEVKSVSETEMLADVTHTVYRNGTAVYSNSGTALWTKVKKDYRSDILGLWEGHVTSVEGSEFDDGETHRWEYLANGSYVYYRYDENEGWMSNVNELSLYFVDGALLCTRWKNSGEGETENREWWEIASIADGVMNWTALRKRDDGTTYTATFQMTKVQ